MCGEVQAQADSLKSLNSDSATTEQGSSQDFIEAIQSAPPEMEDGGQPTISELLEIKLGTIKDPKSIFVSTMLNNEEVVQYEQILWEFNDVFTWGYQDMSGLDPHVAIHKLVLFEGIKLIKQPQQYFHPKLTIQTNAEVDKLKKANFIREVRHPAWLASIVPLWKKNGQLWIYVDLRT